MKPRAKEIATLLIFTGGIIMSASCNFFKSTEDTEEYGEPLARVYDKYLYFDEIEELLPHDMDSPDSLAFIQNYINVWARDQLLIYKAEYNLTEGQKDFSRQIEEYRNDLLKFAYKEEFVKENLDTNVSDTAIRTFYKKGSNNFLLQEDIAQADYVVIRKEAPELKKAIDWFFSDNENDQEKVQDYVLKYAYKFSVGDSSWISFDAIKKTIPASEVHQPDFLKERSLVQYSDETNVYLLRIRDYKLKGDLAPLSYAKAIIRNVLINRKKLKLLSDLEQNLLKDAIGKKEFEVY